ncbi:hypothetical protein BH11ARM2_BH11ARM2_06210 [soil metagenome]
MLPRLERRQFGWGGDTTDNILWRLQHGELDGVNPEVIVLLAGTDLIGSGASADEVVAGIEAILAVCRRKAPEATILLTAIFPREDIEGVLPTIQAVNRRLAESADGDRTIYVDVNPSLTNAQGRLAEGTTTDGLHLALPGYEAWAEQLRPLLTKRLGPPAATDSATPA